MIQMHRLEGFYWVAKTGGYARAARAFPYPITQPAVHQQVKKLEAELGVELLERTGKSRFRLTSPGQALYEFAAPFFEQLPALLRAVRAGSAGGTLSIRAEPILLRYLLPAWVRRLQKKQPQIHVDLRELEAPATKALDEGEADLIVGYFGDVPAGVETLRVGTLYPFLVFPRGWLPAGGADLKLASLQGRTFIGYTPGTLPHQLQMKALAAERIRLERTVAAQSADTILGLVEAGIGFSLVPSLDRRGPRGQGIRAVPLALPGNEFPVVAAWRRGGGRHLLLEAALQTAPTGNTSSP